MFTAELKLCTDAFGTAWKASSGEWVGEDEKPGPALLHLFNIMHWEPNAFCLAELLSDSHVRIFGDIQSGDRPALTHEPFFHGYLLTLIAGLWESLPSLESVSEIEPGDAVYHCPDCKGTGEYVGLFAREKCSTCAGRGVLRHVPAL